MNLPKGTVARRDLRCLIRHQTASIGMLWLLVALSACGVKRMVNVPVPQRILNAKVATREELLSILGAYSKVTSLSSTTMKITATLGNAETGKVQEYHSAPGYILLQRPDCIRLNVQNPLTKNTLLEISSIGDDFWAYYVRDREFLIGKNSARELEIEGEKQRVRFGLRPIHVYEAILPQGVPIDQPDISIAMKEDQDAQAKYYVISVCKRTALPWEQALRDIWIERSSLTLARQIIYDNDGSVASRIFYQRMTSDSRTALPLSLRIERPIDGYTMDMQFKNWKVDPNLPADAFIMKPPDGAQVITLKEKQRSGAF